MTYDTSCRFSALADIEFSRIIELSPITVKSYLNTVCEVAEFRDQTMCSPNRGNVAFSTLVMTRDTLDRLFTLQPSHASCSPDRLQLCGVTIEVEPESSQLRGNTIVPRLYLR